MVWRKHLRIIGRFVDRGQFCFPEAAFPPGAGRESADYDGRTIGAIFAPMPNPTPEEIREFVIAAHGDVDKVKTMLAAQPALLNLAHPWSETDSETAIQAASQVGNVALAEFLLAQGAPLAIYTAAMLGRRDDVTRLLAADPGLAKARGAHGIPLLPHAAMSGDVALVSALHAAGATDGASSALVFAVARRHVAL
jgi:hypothetical protein